MSGCSRDLMADVTIVIPDGHFERIARAMAQQRGLDFTSMSKDEWIVLLRHDVVNHWINVVQSCEAPAYHAQIRESLADMMKDNG